MRIIGGSFRGRRLGSVGKGDEAARLRPTSDRVRESLFNVLAGAYGDPVTNARVLDLFAGTGALGLEALSRGANNATFVENGQIALRLLSANIALCGVENRSRVIARNVRKLPDNPAEPYDLVFLDPPYGRELGETAMQAALSRGWIASQALIVWEESAAISAPNGLRVIEQRRYGGSVISFLERVA